MRIGYNEQRYTGGSLDVPWTNEEWLSYLDGWTWASNGIARPVERIGMHEEHHAYGQLEHRAMLDRKAAAAASSDS